MRPAGSALLALALPTIVAAQDLPADTGRDAVEAACTGCHGAGPIARSSGYTRDGWGRLAAAMVDLSGDPETRDAILDYLAAQFPPGRGARPAMTAEGPETLALETWIVPTPGQRARDPVEDAEGNIWWVGQWADILGRLDPESGEMREFALPAGARPHSVTIGPDGGVWYTGNGNGTLGRLDPATGQVEVFGMPDPAAADPHTAEFDAEGRLWFTLQRANMIGRLDPATGEIALATAPVPGARPYGIVIDAEGNPWVACNGAPCLLRVDPATMEIEEIALPEAGSHVRRLDIDGDGAVWFVNSGLGRLGRYRPSTGEVEEWPSPSGPSSHPYALAVFDGAVWYNESGVRPDMLVRFDPEAETFRSWPIPTHGLHAGIVRHMRRTRDGAALLIHQTATGAILRVKLADGG